MFCEGGLDSSLMASSCSFYAPSVSCSWHLFHSHGTLLTQRRSEVLSLMASSRHRFLTAVSPITGKKAKTLADRDGTTPSSFSVRGVGVAIDRIIFVKLKKGRCFESVQLQRSEKDSLQADRSTLQVHQCPRGRKI